jgi:hypothetical protein
MVRTRVGSGPRLALIKAWVFFVPESRDPAVSGPDPTQRGPGPVPGVRFAPAEVLDLIWRFGLYMQGSDTFLWGPDPLLIPWRILSSLATWWPRSRPRGGSVAVYHASKDNRVGIASSYCSKGYPCFRVLTTIHTISLHDRLHIILTK